MNILFIGDIVGSPGRRIVIDSVRDLAAEHDAELVIANCENAAAGFGITPALVEELLQAGIDVLTGGNHIFDRKEIVPVFEKGGDASRLLRPANYPATVPGTGVCTGHTKRGTPFAVLNLQGRVFMPAIDCPFKTGDRLLESLPKDTRVILLDVHAEATSEKQALGWHFDGRVSAVIGTHTHVPTADERVLPGGTGYITDVGMTGPYESIIGNNKDDVLQRFLSGMPNRLGVAKGDVRLSAVLVEIDEFSGRARRIGRLVRTPNGQ